MKFLIPILITTCLSLSIPAFSQPLTVSQQQELDQLFSSLVDDETPGIAIGIIREGEEVYSFTGGLANMEFGVPITSTTKFNIASNAKQFTALFTLELVSQGVLNLEDDIRQFFPTIYPDVEEPITISHLLQHRSGIRDFYDLLGINGITWWAEEGFSNEDALAVLLSQQELNFSPGSDYLYSNSNYVLLAEIIAQVTEEGYDDWSRRVFSEMGMSQTSFEGDYMRVLPERARPYANWGEWKEYPAIFNVMGDGNLYSSLEDQITWEKMIQNGKSKGISQEVLSQSQQQIDSEQIYGYGIEHNSFQGTKLISHDGNTGAFNASFVRFPEYNLSVVVMSNHGSLYPHGLARQSAQIILNLEESPRETPQAPEELDSQPSLSAMIGQYQHEDGSLVGFVREGRKLYWKQGHNRPFEMEHVEGNLFHMTENRNLKVSFHPEEESPWMVVYYPGSDPRVHKKAIPVQASEDWWNAANGRFRNYELDLSIEVSYQGEQIYEAKTSEWAGQMTMLFRDALRMDDGYHITFIRQDDGLVSEILLSSDRAKNVRFRRVD